MPRKPRIKNTKATNINKNKTRTNVTVKIDNSRKTVSRAGQHRQTYPHFAPMFGTSGTQAIYIPQQPNTADIARDVVTMMRSLSGSSTITPTHTNLTAPSGHPIVPSGTAPIPTAPVATPVKPLFPTEPFKSIPTEPVKSIPTNSVFRNPRKRIIHDGYGTDPTTVRAMPIEKSLSGNSLPTSQTPNLGGLQSTPQTEHIGNIEDLYPQSQGDFTEDDAGVFVPRDAIKRAVPYGIGADGTALDKNGLTEADKKKIRNAKDKAKRAADKELEKRVIEEYKKKQAESGNISETGSVGIEPFRPNLESEGGGGGKKTRPLKKTEARQHRKEQEQANNA